MKKHLLTLSLILISLAACSTATSPAISGSEQAKKIPTTQVKSNKRRHGSIPEGVISVDIVNQNNRLHLLTGKHHQGHKSLWYQFSDDGGLSWISAVKILNNDNIAAKITRGSDAQIAAQGDTIVVAWTKFDSSSRFNAGVMLAARSTDNGQNWEYAETPPDWEKGAHGYIDMAADEHAMHAVWLDSRNGKKDVNASQGLRYARSTDRGLSWKTNKTLDDLSCSCCWNTIKTNPANDAYVLYRDKQPSDLSVGVIDQQQQWKRLNHVGAFNWQFDGCPHIGGGLDFQNITGKMRMHAIVGTGHEEHLGIHYLYSDDSGNNWSSARQLGNESAIHSDIASHDNGRVVAVWDMMTEEGLAIFSADSADQGLSWSVPSQISMRKIRATHPKIVKTKSGFLVVWTENDGYKQTLATRIL